MSDLAVIERNVLTLPHDAPADDLLELHGKLKFIGEKSKLVLKLVEDRMQQRIEETGAPIPVGDGREWRMVKRTEKWVEDVPRAVETMLELGGGDVKAVTDCLGSGAVKPGAFAAFLKENGRPELIEELIKVEVKTTVVEGVAKPVKELTLVDPKFIR